MNLIKDKKGQTLITALIGTVVGLIGLMALQKGIVGSFRATRGVAASLGASEIAILVHLFTDKPNNCAISGLVGLDVSRLIYVNHPIPVVLQPSTNSNANAPKLAADSVMANRKIKSVLLKKLSHQSGMDYVATLEVISVPMGRVVGSQEENDPFTLGITLDTSNIIVSCMGNVFPSAPPSPSPSPSSSPGGGSLGGLVPGIPWFFSTGGTGQYTVPSGKTLIFKHLDNKNNAGSSCVLNGYSFSTCGGESALVLQEFNPPFFFQAGETVTMSYCGFAGLLVDSGPSVPAGKFFSYSASPPGFTLPAGKNFSVSVADPGVGSNTICGGSDSGVTTNSPGPGYSFFGNAVSNLAADSKWPIVIPGGASIPIGSSFTLLGTELPGQ